MRTTFERTEEPTNPTKQHATTCPKLYGKDCICDGYHTFDELYDHRFTLYITLCKKLNEEDEVNKSMRAFKEWFSFDQNGLIRKVWRSKNHSDGNLAFGGTWFLLGNCKD